MNKLKELWNKLVASFQQKPPVINVLEDNGPSEEEYPDYHYYPWAELIDAFVSNLPKRKKLFGIAYNNPNTNLLNDQKVLALSGPRQCGKTEAVIDFILKNKETKFNTQQMFVPYYKKRLGDRFNDYISAGQLQSLEENAFLQKEVVQEMFGGVKFLVFDDANPQAYPAFKELYHRFHSVFDPDLMIIRIL